MAQATTDQQFRDLGDRWVRAEVKADVTARDELSTNDFTLVGQLGFVLGKDRWLHRYRTGALIRAEDSVRDDGNIAVAVRRHHRQATHRGNPENGRFSATHVAIRRGGWRLAGIRLGPIDGARPLAGRPS